MSGPQPKPGVLKITPYASSEAKADGSDLINIGSNESAFPASDRAREAFLAAAATLHRYPEINANALRSAIAEHHGLEVQRIICGVGSDQIIDLLCLVYAGPGDEIVYSAHGFQMYPIASHAVGATPVSVPERELTADVDAILAAVNDATRIVFIANPNNPTGSYLPRDEMARLHAGLPEHVLLVIDAAYAEFVTVDDYDAGAALVSDNENVVMLRTFSKAYALAGLRLGWAYAPEAVIDMLDRVRPPFNIDAPTIAAGVAALEDTAHIERARSHNDAMLPWFSGEMARLGFVVNPSVANFVIARLPEGVQRNHTIEDVYAHLTANGVIVRRVTGYGLPDWLRFSIGTKEEMQTVLDLLSQHLGAS